VNRVPSFTVVIPALNEEAGIENCVRVVDLALGQLGNQARIVVIDDGSSDSTPEKLAALERELPRLAVVTHPVNLGYGAALRSGVVRATEQATEYVVFMDSDLTNDPGYLRAFADRMAEGYDVIKASRYAPGGGVDGVPSWWTALSRLGNLVARLLFHLPVRDCTNGFRAVRTQLIASVELREDGFAVIMEELYRLRPLAARYAEVPIVLTARSAELRVSSFSFGPRAMASYLKYPLLSARDRLRHRWA
jgi:dolichol-phosphate mannosyltransferase